MRARHWIGLGLLGIAAAGTAAGLSADRAVQRLLAEIRAEARTAPSRHGPVEYALWGEGPPALVLHGAGGGFDQGLMIARVFGGDGFRWIAPSRFGYLGSPLPPDASTAAQADALADLLDALGAGRVFVLALSGGVPPALQLALRHPDRVAGLALLSSAPFTPHAPPEGDRPIPTWLYKALFGSDTVYWALSRTVPDRLALAFDARPDLVATASPGERAMVAAMVEGFLPASLRVDGIGNEGAAIDPAARYPLERVAAPALVVHARDDRINTFAVAEALAAGLPVAEALWLDRGGHLLLGHQSAVRATVTALARRVGAVRDQNR